MDDLRRWAAEVTPIEIVIEDPDKERIDQLFPGALKIGDWFPIDASPGKGKGRCIRRALTAGGGILFTLLDTDGRALENEWFG